MADGKIYNFYKGSQNVDHIDKQVNKYFYGNGDESEQLTAAELKKRIDSVLPFFKTSRHWFCICKVLMLENEIAEGDFEGAAILIKSIYTEPMRYAINASDLSSLNTMSFRFEVEKWDPNDSPVTKGFPTYVTIALRFQKTFRLE